MRAGGRRRAPARSAVPGGHVLAVRSVDSAGNPDATPSTLTIPRRPDRRRGRGRVADRPDRRVRRLERRHGTARVQPRRRHVEPVPGQAPDRCAGARPARPDGPRRAAGRRGAVGHDELDDRPAPAAPRRRPVPRARLPARPRGRSPGRFPASRLPAVRLSLNVGATVRLVLDRLTGARPGRRLATWTIAAGAGANVARVPLAVYRRLGPARYRLTAEADAASGRSPARTGALPGRAPRAALRTKKGRRRRAPGASVAPRCETKRGTHDRRGGPAGIPIGPRAIAPYPGCGEWCATRRSTSCAPAASTRSSPTPARPRSRCSPGSRPTCGSCSRSTRARWWRWPRAGRSARARPRSCSCTRPPRPRQRRLRAC